MPKFKLQICFRDRIGIVADIAVLMGEKNFNITSMEVQKIGDEAHIFLEMDGTSTAPTKEDMIRYISLIPDFLSAQPIPTLPQERRARRFQVVLDNVSDGIISVDAGGELTTINRVAQRIFDCNASEVLGKTLQETGFPDLSMLECLSGKTVTNVKKSISVGKGRFRFLATCKPIKNSAGQIVGAVEIIKDMKEIKELAHAVSHPAQLTFGDFVGKNPGVREAVSFAQKIAGTDAIVSIRGESGTGKELFASAIHSESGRSGPFIPVNCAALPESLLESELFGYVGGAFTGANQKGKPGLFEKAQNGTVFLDEIAEMPLSSQAKILRLIQERKARRIGGTEEIPVNVRILTATNKNLEQMVEDRQFRRDLYYRINVLPIHLTPLRDRVEDIPLLVDHFLFQLDARLGSSRHFITENALKKLQNHDWPGNVRELKNVIERAAILCDDEEIHETCILFSFEIGKSVSQLGKKCSLPRSNGRSLRTLIDDYERRVIDEAVKNSDSIRKAAAGLSVSHTTLLNKLKKHGLKPEIK